MLQEYKFVRGKEIETYQDILECEEDGIILNSLGWGDCCYDKDIILRKNDTLTMNRLQQIKNKGYSVYQRVKEYRPVIFTKEMDNQICDLFEEFANDYEDMYSWQEQDHLQNMLIKLKEIISR